jgi:hypothetical protein
MLADSPFHPDGWFLTDWGIMVSLTRSNTVYAWHLAEQASIVAYEINKKHGHPYSDWDPVDAFIRQHCGEVEHA